MIVLTDALQAQPLSLSLSADMALTDANILTECHFTGTKIQPIDLSNETLYNFTLLGCEYPDIFDRDTPLESLGYIGFMSVFIGFICIKSVGCHAYYVMTTIKSVKSCDDIEILFANISLANILVAITFTMTLFARSFSLIYPLNDFYCNHETGIKYTCVFAGHISLYYAAFCSIRQSSGSLTPSHWRTRNIRTTLSWCAMSWIMALLVTIPRPIMFPRVIKQVHWSRGFVQQYCTEKIPKNLLYLDIMQMIAVLGLSFIGFIIFSFLTFGSGTRLKSMDGQRNLMFFLLFGWATLAWLPCLVFPFMTAASVSVDLSC